MQCFYKCKNYDTVTFLLYFGLCMQFTSVDFFLDITDMEAHQILCAFLESWKFKLAVKTHDEMLYSVAKQIMDVKTSTQLQSFVQCSHCFIQFFMVQSILIIFTKHICLFFSIQNHSNTIFCCIRGYWSKFLYINLKVIN